MSDIKEVMVYEYVKPIGDWLCRIPNSAYACYFGNEESAKEFCRRINLAIHRGEISINEHRALIWKENKIDFSESSL